MSSGGTDITAKTEKSTPFREYVDARLGFRNHWYPTLFSESGFPFPEGRRRHSVSALERFLSAEYCPALKYRPQYPGLADF